MTNRTKRLLNFAFCVALTLFLALVVKDLLVASFTAAFAVFLLVLALREPE